MENDTKICPKCKIEKELTEFHKKSKNKTYHTCKDCRRIYDQWRYQNIETRARIKGWIKNRKLQLNYNITFKEYNTLLKKQQGLCAICHQKETKILQGKLTLLAVDHDHITGKIRGLLCNQCNIGLGCFKDDPTILYEALTYVNKGKA